MDKSHEELLVIQHSKLAGPEMIFENRRSSITINLPRMNLRRSYTFDPRSKPISIDKDV